VNEADNCVYKTMSQICSLAKDCGIL